MHLRPLLLSALLLSSFTLASCADVEPSTPSGSSGAAGATSTGATSQPTDRLTSLPAYEPPKGALEFYTPIIKVDPGTDTTWCTFTDQITEEEMIIHTTYGVQSPYGHHAILYYTTEPEQIGKTVECGSVDMDRFHQMLGGTGGEGAQYWVPPDNVGTRIPKGAQFVVQTHWINTASEPKEVQAHVAAVPMERKPDTIIAGSLAIVNTSFEIAAHSTSSSSTTCTMDRDHKLLISLPHEHEWGKYVKATLTRKDGTKESLFDTPFELEWVAHPTIQEYGVQKPLQLLAGDKLDLECTWNNTTDDPLLFPREMCVFFAFTMEDDDAHCSDGAWDHSDGQSAEPMGGGGSSGGSSCAKPGDTGNENGVGAYCTKGGHECGAFPRAPVCLADFGQSETFCTRIGCRNDDDCGADAVCHIDPAGRACVPKKCE